MPFAGAGNCAICLLLLFDCVDLTAMRRSARTRRPLGLRSRSTAAVYRHLQVPGEDGQVEAIGDASGETLCQRCGTDAHHHHLTCRNCGHSVEVEGPAVERWAGQVAAGPASSTSATGWSCSACA